MLSRRSPSFVLSRAATAGAFVALSVCASCSSSSKGVTHDDASFGDAELPTDSGHHDAKDAHTTSPDGSLGCGVCDAGSGGGHDGSTTSTKDSGHDAQTIQKDSGQSTAHDSGHDVGPTTPALGAHTSGVSIMVNTASGVVSRTYDISIPAMCDPAHPVPLVFVMHGDGGNGAGMYGSNFPIEAAAASVGGSAIFVYPDGTDNNIDPSGAARAWDLYHDPGPPPYTYTPGQPTPAESDEASGNADVDFFDTMLEYFEKTYCVDTSRVWMTGMSSGGYASNQFARWRSGVIKATAPQSGGAPFGNMDSMDGTWTPPNYCIASFGKVPTLIIHGTSDGTVDPCNAYEAQSYWQLTNGCGSSANNCTAHADSCTGSNLAEPSTAPTTVSSLNSDCMQTSGCGSTPVVLCMVPGMGHSIWSDAATVIWSFFTSL